MKEETPSVKNMPASIVDAQLQRLLEIVEEFKTRQCEALIAQANQQSQQVVNHSYHNARTRLRSHIQDERQQLQQALAAVRAKQHTFVMQQKHQASRKFLNDSWELLTSKLVQRWENPKQRKLWMQSVADVAVASLPAQEWQVYCAGECEKPEQKQLLEYIAGRADKKVTIKTESSIEAGIRFEGGGAVVDGTLQGLLSDRVRIESAILAQCTNCIVHSRFNDKNLDGAQKKIE